MARYSCSVAGGLHANYAATLNGMDQSWLVGAAEKRIGAQFLAHKGAMEFRALVDALLGAAAGGMATKTYPEIAASAELGGMRSINQVNLVNRVTTANDVADIKKALTSLSPNTTFGANPPINGDRNPLGTR